MPRPITIVVVLTLALLELAAFLVPCPGVAQTHRDVEPLVEPIVEMVSEADYFVRNETDASVVVRAYGIDFGMRIVDVTVPAGAEVRIFHALEGSGGHVMPSNFFRRFEVLRGTRAVYQGVRNGDWQEHPQGYRLTLR
jgi:hypothetical protein